MKVYLVGLRNFHLALIALVAACGSEPPEAPAPQPALVSVPGPIAEPVLPRAPGELAPSFARIPDTVSGAAIADTDTCGGCHPDVLAQWQTSAHAFASLNNPIYRVSVEPYRVDHQNWYAREHHPRRPGTATELTLVGTELLRY